jgi:putative N6-adenine-specific DNA methylase
VQAPLLDPLCGSGTIAIEAALLASQRAPGGGREFAFHRWPSFEPGTWASVKASMRAVPDDAAPPAIIATDRDGGAIESTIANAARAGVAHLIDARVSTLSRVPILDRVRDAAAGVVVTNPPYGRRVSSTKQLRDLYASLGNLVRGPLSAWDLSFLCADDVLARATGLGLHPLLRTTNGGIAVTLWQHRARR